MYLSVLALARHVGSSNTISHPSPLTSHLTSPHTSPPYSPRQKKKEHLLSVTHFFFVSYIFFCVSYFFSAVIFFRFHIFLSVSHFLSVSLFVGFTFSFVHMYSCTIISIELYPCGGKVEIQSLLLSRAPKPANANGFTMGNEEIAFVQASVATLRHQRRPPSRGLSANVHFLWVAMESK